MVRVETIHVEVAYATPQRQVIIPLDVPGDATVEQAIQLSTIQHQFPEVDTKGTEVGIFCKRVTLDAPLREGDRIELYRPLTIDPKQKRKLRAKAKGVA